MKDMPEDIKKLIGIMKINAEYREITDKIQKEQLEILNKLTKEQIIKLFENFINRKPNIDRHNYDSYSSLQYEYNKVSKQKQKALNRLEIFKMLPLVKELLSESLIYAFSGRLSLKFDNKPYLEYTAGQYEPTEYRLCMETVLENYNDKVKTLLEKVKGD